ncbi:MAG: MarR family transcriptional regulator [Clostridia bacterium]|nr:MarR family transcriptional regulator [Clostridia bacterium]
MQREYLAEQILSTFDSIDTEFLLDRLKLSLKGENLLLMILSDLGGSGTPGKIIERLDFTGARLSAIIKSMEGKGLVERRRNEGDKRSTIVVLTQQGKEHYLKLRAEIISNALTIIEQLGEKDVCEFLRIIKKLADIANDTASYENRKEVIERYV